MIVLDSNILIRAVLGRRVRQLLETFAPQGVRFFAVWTTNRVEIFLTAQIKANGSSDE